MQIPILQLVLIRAVLLVIVVLLPLVMGVVGLLVPTQKVNYSLIFTVKMFTPTNVVVNILLQRMQVREERLNLNIGSQQLITPKQAVLKKMTHVQRVVRLHHLMVVVHATIQTDSFC